MTEGEITEEVVSRLEATPDRRLREVRLTDEEWLKGIAFLTATGHITDNVRQEFILLSDTLGFSTLIDAINHSDVESLATEPTILGPFYVAESPWREFGDSMVEYDDGGEPTVLRGVVKDEDGNPIAGAVIDVWQNAASGFYAVQQPDVQPSTNLRGRYRSTDNGEFRIRTVRPVPYPIPDDGPVGKLLQDTGRHQWRAAHIHVKASAEGFVPLTSHIFDRRSDYLDTDTVFGVKDSLIEDFLPTNDGDLVCEHDIVLARQQ